MAKSNHELYRCEFCGVQPAAKLNQYWMTGLILMRNHYSLKRTVCIDCGRRTMHYALNHNVTKGWWSIYAVFINPVLLLIINPLAYAAFKDRLAKQRKRMEAAS